MRTLTTQRLASELRAIRRTGAHPDGRQLGTDLAPAIDRIITFIEQDCETVAPRAAASLAQSFALKAAAAEPTAGIASRRTRC